MITLLRFSPESQALWGHIVETNSLDLPFSTYAWQETWFRILGDSSEPYLLSIDDTLIAPLAKKGSIIFFSGGEEIADYLDLIGPKDQYEQAWRQVIIYLKAQGITAMTLRNIPEDSPTLSFFKTLVETHKDIGSIEKEDTTPKLPLPKAWDDYLSALNRKDRHELERKVRKFEREYPGARIQINVDPTNDIPLLLELMRHDPKKRIFLTPQMVSFFKEIPRLIPTQIRLLQVYVQDIVVASTLSFPSRNGLLLYNSGFDENYRGAGFYLKAKGIEDAIQQQYQSYNFLQGNERYKYELGGKDFFVYRVIMDLTKNLDYR